MLTTALRCNYARTLYVVIDGEIEAIGLVGRHSPDLAALLQRHMATSGIAMTAWNPGSEQQSAATNDAANRRLATDLVSWRLLPHAGRAADGGWMEKGFFALDLPVPDAIALAERYGQFAVTGFDRQGPGRLLFTRLAGQGRRPHGQ